MTNVYNADWTRVNKTPKMRFWVTDDAGTRLPPVLVDLPVVPYFHAFKDAVTLPVPVIPHEGKTHYDREVVKIEVASPNVIPDLRSILGVENTLEADVPYARRVMIDLGISVTMPKRYVHIDIEVDPSRGMPDETVADRRIISIGAKATTGEEHVFCEDDEIALVSKFLLFLDQFPVVCTFNGNHFDEPYLRNRAKRLGIEYWWDDHVFIDLLAVYKFVLQKRQERYTLDYIAKVEELTVQKRDIDITKLMHYFEQNRDTLREYNLADVRILHELDLKLRMVEKVFNIAAITRTTPRDLLRLHEKSYKEFNVSVAVDGLILRFSCRRPARVIWPTKVYGERNETIDEEKYTGALVLEPVPGVHHNVVGVDVASLYPTIIQSLNAGPDTYLLNPPNEAMISQLIRSPVGRGWFHKEPQSVFAEALEYVLSVRDRYKREMKTLDPATSGWKTAFSEDYAYKVLANAFYGVIGSAFSRYYNKDIAENITLTGQLVTQFMKDTLEATGHRVLAGDTDSSYFTTDDLSIEAATKLADDLSEKVTDYLEGLSGIRSSLYRLDVSELCLSMFLPKKEGKGIKKRYAALVVWKGVPTFFVMLKGFEYVRHDSSEAQKEAQYEGILLRLTEASKEQLREFSDHWWNLLHSGSLDEKLVMYKSIGKDPSEYKVVPPHLRVARRLEAEGKLVLHRGDKIGYLKVGPTPEEVVGIMPGVSFPELTEKNRQFLWDSQFLRMFQRLGLPATRKVPKKTRRKKGAQAD